MFFCSVFKSKFAFVKHTLYIGDMFINYYCAYRCADYTVS